MHVQCSPVTGSAYSKCIGINRTGVYALPGVGAFSVACLTDVGARMAPRKRPCQVQGLYSG